jgi:hypothetical protein
LAYNAKIPRQTGIAFNREKSSILENCVKNLKIVSELSVKDASQLRYENGNDSAQAPSVSEPRKARPAKQVAPKFQYRCEYFYLRRFFLLIELLPENML